MLLALIVFEYYVCFISPGQAAAHGGHTGLPEAERVFCTILSHILKHKSQR